MQWLAERLALFIAVYIYIALDSEWYIILFAGLMAFSLVDVFFYLHQRATKRR